jgi:hypothetical protein
MSEKKNKVVERRALMEGYQPTLAGLKGKNGKPLERKDLKPPKGGSAIRRPKSLPNDKPPQA